jgi:hypothetical protein
MELILLSPNAIKLNGRRHLDLVELDVVVLLRGTCSSPVGGLLQG